MPDTWQLLFVAALLAPGIAFAVISPLLSDYEGSNSTIIEFVSLNLMQLKTYMVGIFLTIVVVGIVVVVMAAVWGLLLNSFLLVSDFFRDSA